MTNHLAPLQPLGVCILLFNEKKEVLLGKRKNSYKAGYFGLPGGRIEVNEAIEKAIHRELKEETGLEVATLEYAGVVKENQVTYDFVHFIFVAHDVSTEPVLCEPEKCEGWEWFDLKNLPKTILPGHKAALDMYLQHKMLTDIRL